MRNLFIFIYRHHFYFLFVLLEIVSFYLIIQNSYFQKASFLNSSNVVSASSMSVLSNIGDYFSLKQTNEVLAKENAILKTKSINSFTKYYTKDNQIINDTVYKQKYTYTSAEVINNSINKRNNYLTLNKGRIQGIKPEMAVVSSKGIVGIVKNVSDNFCTVSSLLHKQTRISVNLKHDPFKGGLSWDGTDYKYGIVSDIEKHVKLKVGDTIETSGYSSIFPKGILVGTVAEFSNENGSNFYTIKIKFITDFNRLTYVYIINNTMKSEQDQIEQKSEQEH